VRVQPDPFDLGAETAAFAAGRVGQGRSSPSPASCAICAAAPVGDGDRALPGHDRTRDIASIAAEAPPRWSLTDALVIHRHGRLGPGEAIMMVATAALHRAEAFAAAEFLMDYLKSRAPFWKKEVTAEGADWVAAKDSDEATRVRRCRSQ
jgi:molybdopterin synthase catalytic subunit